MILKKHPKGDEMKKEIKFRDLHEGILNFVVETIKFLRTIPDHKI